MWISANNPKDRTCYTNITVIPNLIKTLEEVLHKKNIEIENRIILNMKI